MVISLHRDSTIRNFLLQPYAETSNIFPSWILVSFAFCLLVATLVSQYVPIVPVYFAEWQLAGLELNKFGATLFAISLYYLLKAGLGFFLYQSIGEGRNWANLYFVSTKFYFVFSLILIILCFFNYYFDVDHYLAMQYYLAFFVFTFIFKQFFYLLSNEKTLPEKWYYKILYICTLQIAPFFALWKLLFI